ncbi:MAG TPA: serine/threonine-protein kinase [Kofleriaceae bacterium]|nr:serine/threonine-protein kinase [Kofleriaceae bacterium]
MIGRVVGKYRLLAQLGEGGMGTVYRAEHVVLGSPAAVKILLPQFTQDAVVVDRFFQEARAASAIRHAGIVEVFDFGRLPTGQAYIAMELLRGEELAGFLARRGALDASLAVQIAIQMLAALNATHLVGVIHRDLKPDNIFLIHDPGAPGAIRVKILDFGIAKLTGRSLAGQPGRPRTKNMLLGTPAYMAPEQCRGGTELDARADLYAVGCLLFELLTGRPPFVAGGDGEVMAMHIYEPPPRLSNLAPHLPVELDALLAKLLTKDPADRIPSAAYALATLERAPVAPLVDEVALSGTHYAIGPAAHAALLAGTGGNPPPEPMPRWIPVAVIAGALAIAIAAAVAIGIT